MKGFQLEGVHFVVLIVLFTLVLYVIANLQTKEKFNADTVKIIDKAFFTDSLKNETLFFVLFYKDNSEICDKVRSNFQKLKEETNDTRIYKLDVVQSPELIDKYNISGVPTILLLHSDLHIFN